MNSRRSIRGAVALALVAGVLVAGCGGDNPEAMVASAKEYLAKNDRSAATIQLKNALQKNPDSAEARFLLGRTLLETGDLLAAEKELRRAAELKYPYDQVAPPLARSCCCWPPRRLPYRLPPPPTISAPYARSALPPPATRSSTSRR